MENDETQPLPRNLPSWTLPMVLAWIMWRDWGKVQRLSADQVTWITFTVEMAFDEADDQGSDELFLDPGDAFTELQSKGVDGAFSAYGRHIKQGNVKAIEQGEWLCFVLDRNRSIYSLHENSGSAAYDNVNFSRDEVLRTWPPEQATNESQVHAVSAPREPDNRDKAKGKDRRNQLVVAQHEWIRQELLDRDKWSDGQTYNSVRELARVVSNRIEELTGKSVSDETCRNHILVISKELGLSE